ncbi:MAG: hypothetical protein AAF743_12755, partial [Planctomycetota bacterium]
MKYVLLSLPLLAVLVGCVTAAEAWAAFLATLLTELPWLAAWGLAAYGIGAAILPKRVDVLDEVTAVGIGLGVVSVVLVGLSFFGLLSFVTGVALLVVGAGLGALALYRDRERWRAWSERPGGVWWGALVAAVPFGLALAAATVYPGLLWPSGEPAGYDVVAYHFQIPREWFEAGRMTEPTHNVYGYFPLAVEMHDLLAFHLRGGPFAGMYLAQLMHFVFMALVPLAVYGATPGTRVAKIASAVLASAVPWTVLLGGVGFNESGLMLYVALAVGRVLRGGVVTTPWRDWVVCGLLVGFACGVKYTAVPMLLIGLPAVVLVMRQWRGALIVGVVGLLTFAPWLLRNAVWTGNPVFPQALGLFGQGHWTDLQVERWEVAHSARPEHSPWYRLFDEVLVDPRSGWVFPLVGLGLGVLTLVLGLRSKRDSGVPPTSSAAGFLLLMLSGWAVFWLFFTHLQPRFFTPAIPIAAMLCVLWRWQAAVPVAASCLVATFITVPWQLVPFRVFIGMQDPWLRLEISSEQVAAAVR